MTQITKKNHYLVFGGKGGVKFCDPFQKRMMRGFKSKVGVNSITGLGEKFVVGADDGSLSILDVFTLSQQRVIQAHSEGVSSLGYHANLDILASSSYDGMVKLWKPVTGKCLHTFPKFHEMVGVLQALSSATLACGGEEKSISLLDVEKCTTRHVFKDHSGDILSMTYDKEKDVLFSTSFDNTIRLFDHRMEKCIKTICHNGVAYGIAYLKNCSEIVVGSLSGEFKIHCYDAYQSSKLKTSIEGHRGTIPKIVDISTDPKSTFFASSSGDNTIRIWHREGEKESIPQFSLHHEFRFEEESFNLFFLSPSNDMIYGNVKQDFFPRLSKTLDDTMEKYEPWYLNHIESLTKEEELRKAALKKKIDIEESKKKKNEKLEEEDEGDDLCMMLRRGNVMLVKRILELEKKAKLHEKFKERVLYTFQQNEMQINLLKMQVEKLKQLVKGQQKQE